MAMEPATRVRMALDQLGTELICSICRGPWKNAAQLECGHCFCSACIQTHLKTYQAEKCPTCRQPAQKRNIKETPRVDITYAIAKSVAEDFAHMEGASVLSPFVASQSQNELRTRSKRRRVSGESASSQLAAAADPSSAGSAKKTLQFESDGTPDGRRTSTGTGVAETPSPHRTPAIASSDSVELTVPTVESQPIEAVEPSRSKKRGARGRRAAVRHHTGGSDGEAEEIATAAAPEPEPVGRSRQTRRGANSRAKQPQVIMDKTIDDPEEHVEPAPARTRPRRAAAIAAKEAVAAVEISSKSSRRSQRAANRESTDFDAEEIEKAIKASLLENGPASSSDESGPASPPRRGRRAATAKQAAVSPARSPARSSKRSPRKTAVDLSPQRQSKRKGSPTAPQGSMNLLQASQESDASNAADPSSEDQAAVGSPPKKLRTSSRRQQPTRVSATSEECSAETESKPTLSRTKRSAGGKAKAREGGAGVSSSGPATRRGRSLIVEETPPEQLGGQAASSLKQGDMRQANDGFANLVGQAMETEESESPLPLVDIGTPVRPARKQQGTAAAVASTSATRQVAGGTRAAESGELTSSDEEGFPVEVVDEDDIPESPPPNSVGLGAQSVSPLRESTDTTLKTPKSSKSLADTETTTPNQHSASAQTTPSSAFSDSEDTMTLRKELAVLQQQLAVEEAKRTKAAVSGGAATLGAISEESASAEADVPPVSAPEDSEETVLAKELRESCPRDEIENSALTVASVVAESHPDTVSASSCAEADYPQANTAQTKTADSAQKAPAAVRKPPVVLPTGVSIGQNKALWRPFKKLVGILGGRVVTEYERDVTHVVTPTIENNLCTKRTLKFMQGVADGKWMVGVKWAEACIAKGVCVDEAPFEITGYNDGDSLEEIDKTARGPQRSRELHAAGAPPLFSGWSFVLNIDRGFSANLPEIHALIRSVDAKVLEIVPEKPRPNTYILESADVDSERAAPVEETSVPRIDVDFLWDSVTAYKILDVDDYKYQDDDSDNDHTPELF
eukprot:m.10699 g.10699  ORF g.10699 m.10699 type:complete len:1025 (-) comp4350_c0_seq1:1863-4937(-)